MRIGERAKEQIDGEAAAAVYRQIGQLQMTVGRSELFAGWYHVDVIGLNLCGGVDLDHGHLGRALQQLGERALMLDRKSTRLNSSHSQISYAVFCLKKKTPYPSPPLL